MKKLILSTLALSVCFLSYAQNDRISKAQEKLPASIKNIRAEKISIQDNVRLAPINKTVLPSASRASAAEEVIGTTYYDLGCNYGVCGNRFVAWSDGTMAAAWIGSTDNSGAAADRGTFYNYFNGSAWGANPTARIESARKGWGQIGATTTGEAIASHTGLWMAYRTSKGTGTWQFDMPIISAGGDSGSLGTLFPRMASGCANGNTLHVLATPNDDRGTVYYYRSPDGGATWDIFDQEAPFTDSTTYKALLGDDYDIDAQGDNVAYLTGAGFTLSDIALVKSTDCGTTWTRTVIDAFPIPMYDETNMISDINNDGIADTVDWYDGGKSVIIDDNGMAHVFWGAMRFLDDDTAGGISYFPGTDGLMYWNEGMAGNPPVMIAEIVDRDNDGVITVEDAIPIYQCSLSGMPDGAIDDNGIIYCVYSSLTENTTNGAAVDPESFRNVYYVYSSDGGSTWSAPTNLSDSDFDEAVWPIAVRRQVGSKIQVYYEKDGEPGNTFQSDPADPVVNVEIVVNSFDAITGINELPKGVSSMELYPNPANDYTNLKYTLTSAQDVKITVSNILGSKVLVLKEEVKAAGEHFLTIDTKDFVSGVYFINATINNAIVSQKLVIQ